MNEPLNPAINQASPNNVVLEYITPNTVSLNLHFILTAGKKLTVGMPYMMLEGQNSFAIKLIDVWDRKGVVYLKVQDLATTKIKTISWNLVYSGEFWLWSLADYETLTEKD